MGYSAMATMCWLYTNEL